MSDWGDVQALVLGNVGRQGDTAFIALLPLFADMFQQEAEIDRDYWFMKSTYERDITSAAQAYPLPSSFKGELIVYISESTDGGFAGNQYVELDKFSDLDVVRMFAPTVDATQKSRPEGYRITNETMDFWPWPNQTYPIRLIGWFNTEVPDTESEDTFTNKWMSQYFRLYVAKLTAYAFENLGDEQKAAYWHNNAMVALKDARAANVARELGVGNLSLTPMRDKFGTTKTTRTNVWRIYT